MIPSNKIRVLIIDDSAYNRRTLGELIGQEPDLEIAGKACDGEEGLLMAMRENPDVITLDLEMPRMDGFSFLRILMAKKPTPVIVISSHAEKEKVFKALELGALDFVAKPTHRISPAIKEIQGEVISKIRLARTLHTESLIASVEESPNFFNTEMPDSPLPSRLPSGDLSPSTTQRDQTKYRGQKAVRKSVPAPNLSPPARRFIAIAASTGGPAALSSIISELPRDFGAGIIIVQHMPPRFTTTFAERLNRQCPIYVEEVRESTLVRASSAYIAPGQSCIEVRPSDQGLHVVPVEPTAKDRYVPSADRMFLSFAQTGGRDVLAVVLTGMGDDGCRGITALAETGATVIAEDDTTAVIPGMPLATIKTGVVKHVLPLRHIPAIMMSFAAH